MYYNEKYYLYPYYGNDEVNLDDSSFFAMINDMYKIRKSNSKIINDSITDYKEKIIIYREYILFIAKLIEELGIDKNVISYSFIINLLLKIGLFSEQDKFRYVALKQDSLYGCLGLQIVKGNGCCRHVANFYKDIFDTLGLYNDKLYCNYDTNDINVASENVATHVINIINYNGKYLGFDMINNHFFRFIDEFRMESMFRKRKRYIFNKPYMDIIFEGLSYDNMIDKLILYRDNINSSSKISLNDYFNITRETRENILSSEDILLDFNNEKKNYIKKLVCK